MNKIDKNKFKLQRIHFSDVTHKEKKHAHKLNTETTVTMFLGRGFKLQSDAATIIVFSNCFPPLTLVLCDRQR